MEIAKYIPILTGLGDYEELSGINGFKISKRKVPNPHGAIVRTLMEIKQRYLKNEIQSKRIVILSHKKLKSLNENAKSNDLCDYLYMKDKDGALLMVITELKNLSSVDDIEKSFDTDQIAIFKTISSFKGLERDIIFLIYPKPEDYKQKYPQYYDDFRKKLYVGASRAKFKLHLMEYPLL